MTTLTLVQQKLSIKIKPMADHSQYQKSMWRPYKRNSKDYETWEYWSGKQIPKGLFQPSSYQIKTTPYGLLAILGT